MTPAARMSWFRCAADPTPGGEIGLPELAAKVRTSPALAERISGLRAVLDAGDRARYDAAKRELPGVTPAGRFQRRAGEGLLEHAGLIVLDFDGLHNLATAEAARDAAAGSPHCALAFVSPSGRGCKALLSVALIDGETLDAETHLAAWQAAAQHVRALTGCEPDETGKDAARLCFMSYDPGARYNPEAVPLLIEPATAPAPAQELPPVLAHPPPIRPRAPSDAARRAAAYVASMPPAVSGQGGHNATFKVAVVLTRGFALPDEEALRIMWEYSARCEPPWSEPELRHKIASARADGQMPGGALLNAARQAEREALRQGPPAAPCPAWETAGELRHADEREEKQKKSAAARLVELVERAGGETWHDAAGDPYLSIPRGGRVEHHRLGSRAVRDLLARLLWQAEGTAAGSEALSAALGVMRGTATFDGPEHAAPVRVAGDGVSECWLDLGDESRRAVRVTAAGWELVERPAPRFIRPAGLLPLPVPERGGRLDEMRELIPVSDADWPLICGFLLCAVRPIGPYPVLCLDGPAGSGKTTACGLLRGLIDPHESGLRSAPRDEDGLLIAARNGAVVALNNLSGIPGWLSDSLCRLAGSTFEGGLSKRALWSDADEYILRASRPVLLNGISAPISAPDLLDRALCVTLDAISDEQRIGEERILDRYEAQRPRMLGALLDTIACALRRLPDVRLDRLPRLATCAAWVEAAGPALGLRPGEFLERLVEQRTEAMTGAIEGSPVGPLLLALLAKEGIWTGTTSELRAALDARRGDTRPPKGWPTNPQAMTAALVRLQPALAAAGWLIERRRTGRGRSRVVCITSSATSARPQAPQDEGTRPADADDRADDMSATSSAQNRRESPAPARADVADVADVPLQTSGVEAREL